MANVEIDDSMSPPNSKRRRLSLKLKRKFPEKQINPEERFALLPNDHINDSKKSVIPHNTKKATEWAVRLFNTWRHQRNERGEEKVPDEILHTKNLEDLCHWLCVCVSEMRKVDGTDYTPRSICQFVSGLQRYINELREHPIRLIDPTNPIFKSLHRVLEKRYRDLHALGIGTTKRQAEIITKDEEEKLWESGVLSSDSPAGLLRAVFYLNGLNFVLRGGDEHRRLKVSQLTFHEVQDPDNPSERIRCVEYTEHGSKNRPGGRHQLNEKNKVVTQFARAELGERCHVFLLEFYLSKLPVGAFQKDVFYMKPRQSLPDSASDPWYTNVPIGHNTLGGLLKQILTLGNIDPSNKSNHSLRATAISRMYQHSVPQKLIMERSGHLSASGVMAYEHTSMAQKKAVCDTLSTFRLLPPSPPENTTILNSSMTTLSSDNPCSSKQEKEKLIPSASKEVSDSMKKMKFSNMTKCVININM